MKDLVDKYIHWLKEGLSFRQVGDWFEITTPFLNHNNDMIAVFVKKQESKFLLTDGGSTLNELELSGVTIGNSERRMHELQVILNGFGVKKSDKSELFIYTDENKFPESKHKLIQAILSIDDMFMLAKPKVESFFLEDVKGFFDVNNVRYVADVNFTGRSGFNHKFDFSIPKSKRNPETIIRAINLPRKDTIGSVLFSFSDTKSVRETVSGLIILNDKEGIQSDLYEALSEYELEFINWSERNKSIDRLVA